MDVLPGRVAIYIASCRLQKPHARTGKTHSSSFCLEQERQPASNGLVFSNIMDEMGMCIHTQCRVAASEYISSLCMFAVMCDMHAGRAGLATAEGLAAKAPILPPFCSVLFTPVNIMSSSPPSYVAPCGQIMYPEQENQQLYAPTLCTVTELQLLHSL